MIKLSQIEIYFCQHEIINHFDTCFTNIDLNFIDTKQLAYISFYQGICTYNK